MFCLILDGLDLLEIHTKNSKSKLRDDILMCYSELGAILGMLVCEWDHVPEIYKLINILFEKWIIIANEDFNLNKDMINKSEHQQSILMYNNWFDMVLPYKQLLFSFIILIIQII
jgi:hypothetical protein